MENSKPVASRAGGKKGKSSANFPPVTVEYKNLLWQPIINENDIPEDVKQLINNFLNCKSTETQLAATKSILDSLLQLKNDSKEHAIKYLVLVLFESEPKHPVKCLLMRQLDQMEYVHDIFTKHLSEMILSYKFYHHENYKICDCVKFVTRLSSCFDNFTLFVTTVKNIALQVLTILYHCILCYKGVLSFNLPTAEKLEVSKVLHQTLHLYLNVYQKATLDEQTNVQIVRSMGYLISELVVRDDVSMDSKTLCAVIEITMRKSLGELWDPWGDGFPRMDDSPILYLPQTKYSQEEDGTHLCFYCALITSGPNDVGHRLDFASSPKVAEHILKMIKNVVRITDRLSGSVSATLCGARALAAAADWLNYAGPKGNKSNVNKDEPDTDKDEPDTDKDEPDTDKDEPDTDKDEPDTDKDESDTDTDESDRDKEGLPDLWLYPLRERVYEEGEVYMGRTLELARLLAQFAERRLQHHVPAVRHLAERIQSDVMLYCLRYHPQEVTGWLRVEHGLGRQQMALLRRATGPQLRAALAPAALLPCLDNDHKQPHVAALLDTYLEKDCSDLNSEQVYVRWFVPVLQFVRRPLGAVVTDVLLKLLAKAMDVHDQLTSFVLPLIESPDATTPTNLKCTLFLLNVILKSNAGKKFKDADDKWKGLISYDVLEAAILDDDDQLFRLCSTVSWQGSAGTCTCARARVVLAFLRDAAHRPRALHQDTLRPLTQFLKCLEKEYLSSSDNQMYGEILQKLRSICMSNLVRGANHYRRGIALFVLKAISGMQLQGNGSEWSLDDVETVLRHLDDSYETNKQMALDILKTCPQTLLREAVSSNNMSSIPSLLEGVSCRLRDAEGAAYKLELLVTTLPDIVLAYRGITSTVEIESVRYEACTAALWLAHRPVALTLLRTQLERVPLTCQDDRGQTRRLIKHSMQWKQLIRAAYDRALTVLEDAAPLVEADSPEGLVPYTFFLQVVEPHPYEPHLYIVGEEIMTSQMMLLQAWTCAKEAWLILARAAQFADWPMLCQSWTALAACVARARHRAVHDHATKAYRDILRRLSEVAERPPLRVGELAVQWVGGADGTRRAAGLAGLVLAVATAHPDLRHIDVRALTHIHKPGAHHAGAALLRARETARAAHDVLPDLVRHALHDADSPDAALQWACVGVVGAGVRRGVGAHAPGGGGAAPGERGRLRTSVFMARYPGLYQYILECVDRATVKEKSMCASVACSLLVLSRLLPDAGEGPGGAGESPGGAGEGPGGALPGGVQAACGSASYHTRRLAAAAAAANLPPTMYLEHASSVLNTLSNKVTPKNLCHGLILRLLAMIDEAPELPWASVFAPGLPPTLWIVDSPCFPLLHEYLNLIIVLVQRYPLSLEADYRSALGAMCGRTALGRVVPGAQPCAARALRVAAALLDPPRAADLITDGLNSPVHEVCLASLECLLSARGEDLTPLPVSPGARAALAPALLARVAHTHAHPDCRRRALHLLVLEEAYEHIFGEVYNARDELDPLELWIVDKLCWYIRWYGGGWLRPGRGAPPCPGVEALYVRALSTHLHAMRASSFYNSNERRVQMFIVGVSKCLWSAGAGAGATDARGAALHLLQEHYTYLATFDDERLVISVLLVAARVRLCEGGYDRALAPAPGAPGETVLQLALALLDFGRTDQTIDDQYQSFDSEVDSELYEEGVWTDRCTDMLIENYAKTHPGQTITPYILSLIQKYGTLSVVCGIHLVYFMKLLNGETDINNLHYKVEMFDRKLKAFDASIQMSC